MNKTPQRGSRRAAYRQKSASTVAARFKPATEEITPQSGHRTADPVNVAEGRLPAAWYRPTVSGPDEGAIFRTARRYEIGGGIAALLLGIAGLLGVAWQMPFRMPAVTGTTSFVEPVAKDVWPRQAARSVTVADADVGADVGTRVLGLADRFIASGDILAARALLAGQAATGDARAEFALAETYDPHRLAIWLAHDVEPNVSYARLLYDAARRGGHAMAQQRLDALK